jgi:Rrf2 family protein
MKISTKGRYGLRAMMDLAAHQSEGRPVFLADVAKRQDISEKYLEHIFSALRNAGLVSTLRGRKGGFLLSRAPAEITASDIITALEGRFAVVDCVREPKTCDRADACAARDIWGLLGTKIEEVLSGFTLKELAEMQEQKTACGNSMYYI